MTPLRLVDLRRLSITARITYGSLAVSLILAAVAVVGIYFAVAAIVRTSTLTLLDSDADPFIAEVRGLPDGRLRSPVEDQRVAVIDPSGTVRLDSFPAGLRDRVDRISRTPGAVDLVVTPRAHYLVLTEHVTTGQGEWTVITARNQAPTDIILARLTLVLVMSAAVVVVAFGLSSLLLTRVALRPVDRMRMRAAELAAGETATTLPVSPAGDELADLATTLNDLIRALRSSADRERQMVSDASHELRTPLAVLQGRLELAESGAGDPDALLADIRAARLDVLRLSDLANNLLELSRIEAAADTGRAGWHELVEEAEAAADRASRLAGADAEVRLEPGSWDADAPEVRITVRDFARVLDNLLSNAIGAVRATGRPGSVLVSLTSDDEEALLAVADTGTGMPADFVAVAFDRFTRSEDARASRTGGGLGLAIVQAIVEATGGSIDLENRPGSGLTVLVGIPHGAGPAGQEPSSLV